MVAAGSTESQMTTRRTLLHGLGAASALGAFPRPALAQGASKVSFTTSWIPEGPNLFAYVARDKGFWAKNGLDVSVARGSGSGTAAQAVAAGTFDFGMAPPTTVIIQASRNLPIVTIGQINYDALMGVAVLASSTIRTPKDLEGRKLGASVASGEYPFLPLYAEKTGVDMKKLDLVQLDGKVRERSLAEKQVDAISSFATTTLPSLVPLGADLRFMLFRDAGMLFYGQALTTQPARIEKDPSLCAAFVAGAMEAVKFAMTNFDEAVDIFLKANSEVAISQTGKAYSQIGLGLSNATNLVPEVKEHGFGYADPARVAAMTDLVLRYAAGDKAAKPDPAALFTNRFAGTVKLSAAELAKAEANAAPYAKYLV